MNLTISPSSISLNLTNDILLSIGKKIGADVNPCICRHTLLAEGIGDKVTEIKSNTKLYLVIIKPKISCSTKDMFKILDSENDLKINILLGLFYERLIVPHIS